MINRREILASFITELITERESYHDHQIRTDDKEFLVSTLTDFVYEATNKFVLGCREHNPDNTDSFVFGVDHEREARNEIVDQLMYLSALVYKRKHTT